ncbi:MAG: hypothetical protein H8E26_00410 [FCB group bacterium]|nr:hypothetical protein [FCB group bacterium]MBL7123262.1 hypothetical protein [Candidatus Neomarinimicrobiota bacterium]
MRKIALAIIVLTTSLLGSEGLITLKSHIPGIFQIHASTAPQIAVEVRPLDRFSFELGVGYAFEKEHRGSGANSLDVYQSSGEKSLSLSLFYNLFEKEKSDFKVYVQSKFYDKSYLSFALDRVGDDLVKVYANKWLKSVVYSMGFEPTLMVSDNFSLYTRFGISAYTEPGKYEINSDAGSFPEDLVWEKVEESTLHIGTSMDTWVFGIGYTF